MKPFKYKLFDKYPNDKKSQKVQNENYIFIPVNIWIDRFHTRKTILDSLKQFNPSSDVRLSVIKLLGYSEHGIGFI